MKIFLILIMLVTCVIEGNTQQSNPPPEPDPGAACGHYPEDYFAIVSRLLIHRGSDCEPVLVDFRSDYGMFGARAEYVNPTMSVYFKTHVNFKGLAPQFSYFESSLSYMQFVEISSGKGSRRLPTIDEMLVQTAIVYSKKYQYQLLINYKTATKKDSILIDIAEDYKEFDLTLAWVNSGCIHQAINCDNSLGQIEARLNYTKSEFDQVVLLKDLNFRLPNIGIQSKSENPKFAYTNTVYWGELDVSQLKGHLILSKPVKN